MNNEEYAYRHKNKKAVDPHQGQRCKILTDRRYGGYQVQVKWEDGTTAVVLRSKIVRAK